MGEAPQLKSARFRAQRESDWRALETLVTRHETSGGAGLDLEEAQSLSRLYRKAMTSLAAAREISLDKGLLAYLETLVQRAYLAVYAPQETLRGVVARFFAVSAPRAMRASGAAIALAAFSMTLGALIAAALFAQDQEWFYTFIPEGLAAGRTPDATTEALRASLFEPFDGVAIQLSVFASYLISHNVRVALFAFALGVFACAPSIVLLIYNGLILGAFAGLYADRGLGFELFGWLSVHGVTELSAIVIAAAGGFRMGFAALFPGPVTRRTAVRVASRDAVKLALVSVLMLLAAGFLEAFPRQLVTDTGARLAIGWGVGALWLAWFLLAGRRRS